MEQPETKKKYLTRAEALALPIPVFNTAILKSHPERLREDFATCKHCGRLHWICCICVKAQVEWGNMVEEVRSVERQQADEYERQNAEDAVNAALDNVPGIPGGTNVFTRWVIQNHPEIYVEYKNQR